MALNDNNFDGILLAFIGNFTWLRIFLLDGNRISGSILNGIENLVNLERMELWESQIIVVRIQIFRKHSILSCGTIPKELFSLSTLSILLNLSHNNLNGSFPEEVKILGKLGASDVSNNMLSGEIPGSLGSCLTLEIRCQIPKFLEQLDVQYLNDLSFNDFDGEMPLQGAFKNACAVSVEGNSRLCGGVPEKQLPPCKFNKSNEGRLTMKLKIIIAAVCGLLGATFLLSVLYFFWLRMKNKTPRLKNSENLLPKVCYRSLLTATSGFSSAHLIGNGKFGSVYKGIVDEVGTTVAIKVLNLLRLGASKIFVAECQALRNIRHRNLVKILTACSGVDYHGNDFKALIYEFMVNGSLEKLLHPTPRTDEENEAPRSLNLLERLNIAVDVACALEYLHKDCQLALPLSLALWWKVMVASYVIQKRILGVNRRKPIRGIEVAIHSTGVGVEPLSPDDDELRMGTHLGIFGGQSITPRNYQEVAWQQLARSWKRTRKVESKLHGNH
ncbi:probable LRR receptor-like serine/threonine-protein kinase At3g47570 [Populus nigra]|uniref:probable LRR receptor-like serine/threonine-protein kinase At3g47570 n=1 Tax=Populus nigra TaxID=3691 RepID=UPI002B26F716|nr:probable LRR receptor-like serine/threonine-protein kinase At3g47570 [Populus nigra]